MRATDSPYFSELGGLHDRVRQGDRVTERYESAILEGPLEFARSRGDLFIHGLRCAGEVNRAQHPALVLGVGICAATNLEDRHVGSLASRPGRGREFTERGRGEPQGEPQR